MTNAPGKSTSLLDAIRNLARRLLQEVRERATS